MARICCNCGKKIGTFANDPLSLKDDQFLCYECAEPINDSLNLLYYAKTIEEFDSIKLTILEKCKQCYSDSITECISNIVQKIPQNTSILRSKKQNYVNRYMLTTGYEFSGYKITQYCGVISGQVVLGTGFLSEFSASFADFFGDESNSFAEKLETAKNAAIERLVLKSDEKGGNAVIGVDFDYITFHGNMIGVIANGTSVVIEKEQ